MGARELIQRWPLCAALVLSAVAIAARLPPPQDLIFDPHWGVALSGARQLLYAGEHPAVDFFADYGVLFYYASALFQLLLGERYLSEIVLCALGYLAAYLLLFSILRGAGVSARASLWVLFCALVITPGFFRYYVVLWPLASLYAAHRYLREPSGRILALLSVLPAIAGLYRPDLGAISYLAMVVAVSYGPEARRNLLVVHAVCFAALAPWLLYLVSRSALVRVILEMLWHSADKSQGLALAHPLLQFDQPYISWLYIISLVAPLLAFAFYARSATLTRPERGVWMSTIVVALFGQIQATHRADYPHWLESLPPVLCLLALGGNRRLGIAALTCLLAVHLGVRGLLPTRVSPTSLVADVSLLSLPRVDFVGALAEAVAWAPPTRIAPDVRQAVQLASVLLRCTEPEDRIWLMPMVHSLYYASGRLFAGRVPALVPGVFQRDYFQDHILEALERAPPAFVLWSDGGFVGLTGADVAQSHARIFEHLRLTYHHTQPLGIYQVYSRDPSPNPRRVLRCSE